MSIFNVRFKRRGNSTWLLLLAIAIALYAFWANCALADGGAGSPQYNSPPPPPDTSKTTGLSVTVLPKLENTYSLRAVNMGLVSRQGNLWKKYLLLYWIKP